MIRKPHLICRINFAAILREKRVSNRVANFMEQDSLTMAVMDMKAI